MNIIKLKNSIDEIFFEIVNRAVLILVTFGVFLNKEERNQLSQNRNFFDCYTNASVLICGNGPSVNEAERGSHDLVITCNQAHRLHNITSLKPDFHIIVDRKICDGTWDLAEIVASLTASNHDCILILNVRFYKQLHASLALKKIKVIWIFAPLSFTRWTKDIHLKIHKVSRGGAVVEQALIFAQYVGASKVTLTGIEGDGLCRNLIGLKSHGYGSSSEDMSKPMSQIVLDLASMSNSIRCWLNIEDFFKKKNTIVIKNETPGGLLDVFKK